MTQGPSQGLNLGGQPGAYGDTFNALNLFHGADAWITFDGSGNEIRNQVAVDSEGWLTELPVVNGVPQTVSANIFYTKIMPPGDYIVEWTGEGTLSSYSPMEALGDNKFRIKFDGSSAARENGITIFIESTDPNNTGNYIRDIQVYNEKHSDLIAFGEKFDPKWFQAIDDFRVLRTHDWQGTNFSTVTGWVPADQTSDQAFWVREGRGMPYELLVEMANETRSDLWINIPHLATDDYMKKAAEYVKANLDPDLRVYVEYTNEYWTTIFDQHPYLIQQGAEKFGNAPFANAQAYGARASEMAQIFKAVFGTDGARLYPTVTLNHSAFNTQEAITMLTTPAYVAQGGLSPLQAGIRHLATDGYLYWGSDDPTTGALIDTWLDDPDKGYGAARDYLIAQLNDDLAPAWVKGRALADLNNLSFGVYEGGALLINGSYEQPGPDRFLQFNKDVQLSLEMRQVYEATLAAWQATGSGPFAWYSDTGRAGQVGDYGLWNAPDFIPELRTEAIIEANTGTAPWWSGDNRPASAFDNGKYDIGTVGADTMTGTNLADRLYSIEGSDTIFGLGGADRLVGGIGGDTLYGGNAGDDLYGGAGNDNLKGDAGNDVFYFSGAGAGLGLDLAYGGAGSDTLNFTGVTTDTWVDLAHVGVEAWARSGATWVKLAQTLSVENVVGTALGDQIWGDSGVNSLDGAAGADRITGRGGADILKGGAGNDVFHFTGAGAGLGLDLVYGGADSDTLNFTGLTSDIWVDLAYAGVEAWARSGATWVQLAQASDVENVTGTAFGDQIWGDAGANAINGAAGRDTMTGRAGADIFRFSPGDSGSPASGFDIITDFAKGVAGTGDKIDFSTALTIGGSTTLATGSRASISAATGLATFAAGSGSTLADALSDINVSFTAGGNAAGELALFEVNATGDTYMLVSDGVAGIAADDVLIRLNGITSIGAVSLSDGDLMIVM